MIRLHLVEDRPDEYRLLARILAEDGRFELVGWSQSTESALGLIHRQPPDVVLLRWSLAGAPGLIRQVSAHLATPVIALVDHDFHAAEALALRQGAVSAFLFPPRPGSPGFEQRSQRLCDHVAGMSSVRIIRRRLLTPQGCAAVGVVASTGGPAAMAEILSGLPADFPAPILVVQHITAEFSDSFVDWLDAQTPLVVRLAEHEQATAPGHVYVASPNRHLAWDGRRTWLRTGEPECGQCPSGNVLLRSLAATGLPTVGVVLTGLGEDGASGLLALRQVGCHTLVQDRATSAIYGMPAAAHRLGAATEELALDRIAARLLQLSQV